MANDHLQLPCFLVFLEGFIIWLNFSGHGSPEIFTYYPVILIGLSLGILFFPAKVLYHRSRQWWIYSNVGDPISMRMASLTRVN